MTKEHIRIVSWNIQQGGEPRREHITQQLAAWQPDICLLLEYGNTDASRWVRNRLHDAGLSHTIETVNVRRYYEYGMLLVARWPLTVVGDELAGALPMRWRLVRGEHAVPLTLGCVHVTQRSERPGNKYMCLDALAALKQQWAHGSGLIVGDFNTGRRGIDEACSYFNEREDQFMGAMTADGWVDAFRHMQGERRVYSWGRRIAGEMCGLRVDHAFVSPSLVPYLAACDLHTVEGASDHAALIVDIAAP